MMGDPALREQVIQRLLAASDVKLNASELNDATSLREDLDMSSLVLVTLAAELEDELKIDIDDEELSRVLTIGDLFEAIENSQRRSRSG